MANDLWCLMDPDEAEDTGDKKSLASPYPEGLCAGRVELDKSVQRCCQGVENEISKSGLEGHSGEI